MRIIATGDRFGDVTVQQGSNPADGRFMCVCDQGHTLYYKQAVLESRNRFCFICTPSLLKINFSGQNFGRVSILAIAGQSPYRGDVLWQARCECSREFQIAGTELEAFTVTGVFSCGCLPTDSCPNPYLAGRAFGRLSVMRSNPKSKVSPFTSWLCQCECGRQVVRTRATLFDKQTVANCGIYACRVKDQPVRTPISLDASFRHRITAAFDMIVKTNLETRERHQAATLPRKKPSMPETWDNVAAAMVLSVRAGRPSMAVRKRGYITRSILNHT